MIIVTTDTIVGKEIKEVKGLVQGSVVLSKNMFADIGSSFKTIVGGELKAYTDMMEKSRNIASERLEKNAETLGANAIVGVKIASSSVMQGASEILIYGTAVVVE